MKPIFYLAASTGLMLWALCLDSCTSGKWPEETSPDQGPDAPVEWVMSRVEPRSRAATNADGSGRFEEGDSVVLYARNLADGSGKYFTLRRSGGGWVPEIRWAEIGDEVQFTAWHLNPAIRLHQATLLPSEYRHTLAADQQGSGYVRSDLLRAQARARAGEKVQLSFGHALSRLRIIPQSRDASYSDEELQQAEIEVLTPDQLPFDLAEGVLNTPSENRWITPAKEADNSRIALLAPQKAARMPADGWIRIRIDGQQKDVKIPETVNGQPFDGLEAGMELTYRLNLQRAVTQDSFAGTTRWVYGVKEPADELWNYDHTQLAWTEGCGWFDCNKVDPSDISTGGDGLMCWAAATSNLIHWWLEQNRDTQAVKGYNGPAASPSDMLHSEIFQLYKRYFPNQGDYPLKAINWFFNGVFHKKLYDSDPVDTNAGFFRSVLGAYSLGAEYVGTEMKRDRFNEIIRQALTARQGILFVVNLGKTWNTHAVTLWGAKFDDDGRIETLYMVDNNDGRSDTRGTIRSKEVRYLPYSPSNPELYPYIPNSVGDFTVRIESLCTLSLGRDRIQ